MRRDSRKQDSRWITEVPELPSVLVYGATEAEARNKAIVLSLQVIADRFEAGEPVPFDRAPIGLPVTP